MNNLVLYTEYKQVSATTGWKSPSKVKENSIYGRSSWINLKNLMFYDDTSYAICEKGVTKDISSNNIYLYDFGFNIPAADHLSITDVSVRFKCLDDTVGGGAVIDDLLRLMDNTTNDGLNLENNIVNNEYWSSQRIREITYKANDWLTYDLTRYLVNDETFGFTYRCKGTTDNTQIPMMYGIQVKVDYTYIKNVETSVNSAFNIHGTVSNNTIQQVGKSTILHLDLSVANNQAGVLNNLYIKLSDNLRFADNTGDKTIPAKNVTNTYEETLTYTIKGVSAGIGTIRITGANLTDPITLTVLIATENKFNDKLISIHNSSFNNNQSTQYGGGWYNGNNSIAEDNFFSNNKATIAGNDYYDAKTTLTPHLESSYEVNIQKNISCTLTKYLDSNTLVTSGTVTLYEDTNEIATSSIDNTTGTAVFNYKPTVMGAHTLLFKYSGDGLAYTKVEEAEDIIVTKSRTHLNIESNNLEQNTYFGVTLYDTAGNIIPDKTIRINLCRKETCKDYFAKTDSTGTAYLMISLYYGSYGVHCYYTGDDSKYEGSDVSDTLTVTRKKVNLITKDVYTRYGETASFTGTLLDNTNSPLKEKTVYVSIDNYDNNFKKYELITDSSGEFSLPLHLMSRLWRFKTEFDGDDTNEAASTDNMVYVYDTGTNPSNIYFETNTLNLAKSNHINLTGTLVDSKSNIGLKQKPVTIIIYNSKDEIIENVSKVTTDSNGNFEFTHEPLDVDSYRILGAYAGDSLYDGIIATCTVNVVKVGSVGTIIESSDYYNTMGNKKDFTIRLTTKDGAPLTYKEIYFKLIHINGFKQYLGTTDANGYATLPIGIAPNVFDITTNFLGDEKYDACTNKNILVMYNGNGTLNTYFEDYNEAGEMGQEYTYKYKLFHNTTVLTNQITNFTLENVKTNERSTVKVNTNADGEACCNIGKVNAGFYWVNLNFVGDGTYKGTFYDDVILINKSEGKVTKIEGKDLELHDGEEVYYTPRLTCEGQPLVNKTILSEIIHSNGTRFFKVNNTDEDGYITQRINFEPDKYTITNYYSEEGKYRSCTGSNIITVNNNSNTIPTKIVGNNVTLDYGDETYFNVTLTNLINGAVLINKTVTFEILDKDYNKDIFTVQTDNLGIASYKIKEYTGIYTVNYSFMGDTQYNQSNGSNTITVNVDTEKDTDIKTYDTTLTYDNGSIFAKIFHEGEPIVDATMTCTLIHQEYGSVIVKEGISNTSGLVSIPLTSSDYVGEYKGTMSFAGDTEYKPSSKDFILIINAPDNLTTTELTSQDVDTIYNSDAILPVVITTTDVTNVIGHRIQFRFSNRQGDVYDYEKPIVSVGDPEYGCNLDLSKVPGGFYDVIITYPVQTTYETSTTFVNVNIKPAPTSITGTDITVSFNNNTGFEVTVTDVANNEPVVNRYVVFKIDNYSYNGLTDINGIATFNDMLSLGKHTIYYKVVEDDNYYTSSGDAIITVVPAVTGLTINDKTSFYGDTLLYSATLLHEGRAVIGATIIFTITNNGVSTNITAETNSRGQAKILLTRSVGEYTIVARFDGMSGFEACVSETKTISIKRQPTILTVSDLSEDRLFTMNLAAQNKRLLNGKTIVVNITESE